MWPYVLFILGLILLIKGGDWFVDGATGIAHKLHIPELIIGATVVSIGTTLPEVMVSATSAMSGHGEMSYGNAIGSIICNTALIAAITIAVKPSKVDPKSFRLPVLFFFGTAIFYAIISYTVGYFSRIVGILLLVIFVIYMIVLILQAKKSIKEEKQMQDQAIESEDSKPINSKKQTIKDIFLLIIGAVLIAIGANLLVDNGTKIATSLGVPESVIALTFVALGTSLPELVTAITSLVKGHGALSLGNIIGANLFNLVLVSGMSITLMPFSIPQEKMIAGINASLLVDIPVMLCAMAIMALPALFRGKLSRSQGILLLIIYAAFCVFQFVS
ncbi:MAG: calcium/sodium antiporter [Prevotella sp.]|nr:calcium/sodium antiporter [Staphylococcus sp.]MCM1350732.1 calcium/sodium antiporter [Prevotella sp.]